ncbi:MAG: hypothetical protein J7L15_01380 [Clostridiales bacterium]|nr:hypothetical protein [Clostridiales bacterium]
MALRITEEERSVIKDEFINENSLHINKYYRTIIEYANSKSLLSEQAMIQDTIGHDKDRIEKISQSILFVLSTMEEGNIPLQSLAGSLAGIIAQSDSIENRTLAMMVSMELLMVSEPYAKVTMSKNGHLMITTCISDPVLIHRNIVLPLTRPTEEHKMLGSYNWKLEANDALDILNKTKMKILNISDPEPDKPTGNKFSKAFLKQQEIYNKWEKRVWISSEFKNQTIYFNWAADYRVRMYPVGYYLNPQGDELEKNMLGFSHGEKLNFKGIGQLKKSIASAFGLDKKTDSEKIEWFNKHQYTLSDMQVVAKEPYTFEVLMNAWNEYIEEKQVHTPIEIDATNSQAQIMAVLLKSNKIAETCNVVNVTNDEGEIQIADLYQLIADEMSDIIAKGN